MFDKNSNSYKNRRNSKAIVCPSQVGKDHLIQADDLPDHAFSYWKEWSDQDYRATDRGTYLHDAVKEKLTRLQDADGRYPSYVPSPEALLLEQEELSEQELLRRQRTAEQLVFLKTTVTEKQFRYLWLHYVDGLTFQQIGALEGCSPQNVHQSIRSAKRKLKKFAESE